MSKSKGETTVEPASQMIEKYRGGYGSFGSSCSARRQKQSLEWQIQVVTAPSRFLRRLWALILSPHELRGNVGEPYIGSGLKWYSQKTLRRKKTQKTPFRKSNGRHRNVVQTFNTAMLRWWSCATMFTSSKINLELGLAVEQEALRISNLCCYPPIVPQHCASKPPFGWPLWTTQAKCCQYTHGQH